ncbi:MAG: lysophospholipid acyltransferase family protein [Candidatus Margulisiibacteriota bacterium]
MSFVLTAYFFVLFQVGIVVLAALSFVFKPFGPRGERGFYACLAAFLRFLIPLSFIRVEIRGRENIPRHGRLILAGNHPGLLEPMYLIAYLPLKLVLVADDGLTGLPFLGRVIKTAGCLTYRRRTTDVAFLIGLRDALADGQNLLVFPKQLRRLGAADKIEYDDDLVRTAAAAGATIVPFVVEQPGGALLSRGLFVTPGKTTIRIGKPLPPRAADGAAELQRRFEQLMEGG